MPIQRGVAFNTSLYTIVLAAQKMLSFFFFSYLARSFGAAATGDYFFAMSVAAICATFIDLGITPVLTRNIARDENRMREYVVNALFVKCMMAAIVVVGAILFLPAFITDFYNQTLILCALALAFVDSLTLSIYGAIRARQSLTYESIGAIAFQLFILIVGSLFVYLRFDIRLILGVVIVASMLHASIGVFALVRVYGIRIVQRIDIAFSKKMVIAAIPFFLAAAFVKISAYSDTLFLKLFLDNVTLGIYSVAYKITFAFQFIPLALMAALYPAFSRHHAQNPAKVQDFYLDSSKYLLLVIAPIVLGIIALAPEVIPLIYTDAYRASIPPLVILLLSLPMVFLSFPIGSLLNAIDAQNIQTINQAIAMIVAIVANVILIPRFGAAGAATASFLGTSALFIVGVLAILYTTKIALHLLLSTALRIAVAAAVMFAAVLILKNLMPWYMTVVPGAALYILLLMMTGILSRRSLMRFSQRIPSI